MTKPRDPDALLSAYLAVGMEILPDRVVDSVLDEVHRTRQRTVFGPWRTRSMFRSAFATATVVAVIALGGAFFIQRGQPSVVGPNPTAGAVPSSSLPGAVAPSAGPSKAPTSSAITNPAGVWIATGSMGTPRGGFTAVRLLDGRVLVAGGGDATNKFRLTSAELYDPASGTWSATGDMVHPQGNFPATLLRDGRVLVGVDEDPAAPSWDDSITGAEVYDPESGTWTTTGKMVNGADLYGGSTATLLANGKVLVAGDKGAELYDPANGTWSATGKMITPRHHHTATLLPDGRVLVAGGDVGDGMVYSAELYDPDTASWTATANTRSGGHCAAGCPRANGTATLLQDGTLLFIRLSSSEPIVEFVEIYDPATGTWTPTGDMARPDATYFTATRLLDGTVLVAGASGLAELYDPTTGSWTETANMLFDWSSATLLLDGTVLVAGGSNCSDQGCVATGSAELYVPRGVPPPDLGPFPIQIPTPTPVPTPSPTPTAIPTPFPPEAGPVPPGARSWKVTVVNMSPEPATLFLAELGTGHDGMGQLCGSVTPTVVPAGVTTKVTFLLPPKTVKSCWLWVNPPPGGALFQTSDAPLAGEIRIVPGEEGWSPVWVSP
jgi:hypothetical protein